MEDFGCSNGWLECFKDIHCLSFKTICGETAAVDGDSIEDWKNSVLKDQVLSTVGKKSIRALEIVLAIFLCFECQFLSFYAC